MAYRPKDTNERIIHRLKISLGHLKKVIRMVEDDTYCIDVIHQSHAVQKALKETDALILENHLQRCVMDSMKKGKEKKAIDEVMSILKQMP